MLGVEYTVYSMLYAHKSANQYSAITATAAMHEIQAATHEKHFELVFLHGAEEMLLQLVLERRGVMEAVGRAKGRRAHEQKHQRLERQPCSILHAGSIGFLRRLGMGFLLH